jgi:hypothetical protein
MKTIIILVAIVFVALILKACVSTTDQAQKDTSRPSSDTKPTIPVENDKLILVSNVSFEEIKKALTEFCNIYNKKDYSALPRITSLSTTYFAVTFPYNTDFATFCFAVNYLKYPIDGKSQPKVTAWLTTKEGDEWITDKSKNKKVMLFLAEDDKEYDNVFMTTEDNIGYKLGFAVGEEKQLLQSPKEPFRNPDIDMKNHSGIPFVDIE